MTPDPSGRARARAAAAIVALVAACTTVPPPTATEASRTTIGPVVSAAPATTARPSPVDPASVDIKFLGADAIPADVPVSADGQVLWAAGDRWAGEIWRFTPGIAAPERLFASPRPEATISAVVASAAGYAFVEQSDPAFGEGGWRVWYLSGPGAEPVQLDQGIAKEAGFAPTLAMDGERVVWAGFDEPSTGWVTRVRSATIADLRHVATLVERPVEESLIWYPALDRNELWFSTIHPRSDPTAEGPEYNLETLDLANPAAAPVVFDGTGHDFNPAVSDSFLVWKVNRRGDAALNWGTLKVLDRGSQTLRTIPVENANRPSIGNRFVAFDEISHQRLLAYDLLTRTVLDLEPGVPAEWEGGLAYGGASLSGRLLTFSAQPADASAPPRIGWAMLPE